MKFDNAFCSYLWNLFLCCKSAGLYPLLELIFTGSDKCFFK